MLSGVIFVALALLWALFLIPKALRSHDEAARPRSVESTSEQARVLPRRDAAPVDGPALDLPTLPEQRRPSARALAERQRRAAATAARRRRAVLGALLAATLVVAVLAATGVLLPWAPVVPVAVVAAFLVVARVTVRREGARWDAVRSRLAAAPDSFAEAVAELARVEPSAEASEHDGAARPVLVPVARNDQGVAVVSEVEDTSAFSAELLAEAVGAPASSTLWDPLPVTLPTYVGKPRATRSVRTIDLNAPGVSSSGRNAADSALVAESATATVADQDATGRRAVGG